MTTKERKEILRDFTKQKYEHLKFKVAMSYHEGEFSADDMRMRKKFLTREANIRLAEIDQMNVKETKKLYSELID